MNSDKVIVPFRKEVDLTNPKDWIEIELKFGKEKSSRPMLQNIQASCGCCQEILYGYYNGRS